jgi:tRNA uridine 5-carbamoylmethylation protein Kti12
LVKKEEVVSQAVAEAKKEVIDIVEEIKSNLNGLKALLSATLQASQNQKLSPTILRSLTDLYREHRQSIEACERLTSKLTETTTLSEAELLRILYIFSKDLCPDCLEKFRNNLDEYLRKKGYGAQSFS